MAKKKKPAGNPARGFATTSVASKPKPEKTAADVPAKQVVQAPDKESATAPEPTHAPTTSQTAEAPKPEVAPTPEELEAQLERDELQLLVETHLRSAVNLVDMSPNSRRTVGSSAASRMP